METERIHYFTPKFWPDREHRAAPDDEALLEDEPAMTDVLRYRQNMRLYYRNWMDVWQTYSYFTNYGVIAIPLIALFTWSWQVFIILAVPFFFFKRYIGKRLWGLRCLGIIVQGLFDRQLSEHFGYLLPFDDE